MLNGYDSKGIIEFYIEPNLSLTQLKNPKFELDLNLIELYSNVQNSNRKMVKLFDSTKFESIKKLINNYT